MIEGKTKTIVWDSNSQPPKNMIWAPNDNEFLEYKNGEWAESEEVAPAGSGSGFTEGWTLKELPTEPGDIATYSLKLSDFLLYWMEECIPNPSGSFPLNNEIHFTISKTLGDNRQYNFGINDSDIGCSTQELSGDMVLHMIQQIQ